MPQYLKTRHYLTLSLTALLAACATTAPQPVAVITAPPPKPAPVIVAPAPVPLPSLPSLAVETEIKGALISSAATHASFIQAINQVYSSPLQSEGDINSNMDALTAIYSPNLGLGVMSYGALVGAQNTAFIDGIIQEVQNRGVDGVAYQLYADPNYVTQISGAYNAGSDIQAAWQSDINLINQAAANVKARSYAMQKEAAWAKKRTDNRKSRIAAVKAANGLRRSVSTSDMRDMANATPIKSTDYDAPARRQDFWRVFGKSSTPQSYSAQPASLSVNTKKALTLAALDAVGASGPDSSSWMLNYMSNPILNQCTNWARLHVEQCLAAGHYKYEDTFCIAEHQLSDASDCLTKSTL